MMKPAKKQLGHQPCSKPTLLFLFESGGLQNLINFVIGLVLCEIVDLKLAFVGIGQRTEGAAMILDTHMDGLEMIQDTPTSGHSLRTKAAQKFSRQAVGLDEVSQLRVVKVREAGNA